MESSNRIIKFRAWDKDKKEMIQVRSVHFDTVNKVVGCFCNKGHTGDRLIKNFELMQYTGLKDINGKEIYEGDIAKWRFLVDERDEPSWREPFEVKFINNAFNITPCQLWIGSHNESDIMCEAAYEVIGNIYENPELL